MSLGDTPVMQQYKRVKVQHPDALVMFRMGDFYEMFGDDAVVAAEVLQITLTRRRTAKPDDPGIPMCGVPFHAAEGYIGKLIAAGYRVALTEQTEDPKEAKKARGSGALVNRDVVRVFTPGTLTEESYLGAASCYVAAVYADEISAQMVRYTVAYLDVSAGLCGVETAGPDKLPLVLARLPIAEMLTDSTALAAAKKALPELASRQMIREESSLFHPSRAEEMVKRAYGVTHTEGLLSDPAHVIALGAVLAYAELTQVGKLPPLRAPHINSGRAVMAMDASTRRNLELTEGLASGRKKDSLLGVLDRAITGPGSRLLARWVSEPLTDVAAINARLDAVSALVNHADVRDGLRDLLKQTGDVARCLSRLLLGRGSPRDVAVLRQTLAALPRIQAELTRLPHTEQALGHYAAMLGDFGALHDVLTRALVDETDEKALPVLTRDGGFIRAGFDAELDTFRDLVDHGNERLAELERLEAGQSGLTNLKLRYNQVWGYFFEISKAQAEKERIPEHFIHRQTTTNGHRYTTEKLMGLERDLGNAGANTLRRELFLFEQLVATIKQHSTALLDVSIALATLDALAGMAETAARHGWVRPLVDDSQAFEIKAGRHPVVAGTVAEFIPNDCVLSNGQLWLITGPNMAGKSTFLRQNALLTILAQMGSFIPAESAHIGVADAVFSRIGAGDNLAAGQSTFMVEMVETAQILNRATAKSLVILDELGRGTATYDGLAIAWACVEDVAGRIGARTLFATHYHELTTLEETLPAVQSYQVAVREWQGEVVFLHHVVPGAAAGSFGVQVAKLAGVPAAVVKRASALLASFEKTAHGTKAAKGKDGVGLAKMADLALFTSPTVLATPEKQPSAAEVKLKELDVDELSPKQALEILYTLKGLV